MIRKRFSVLLGAEAVLLAALTISGIFPEDAKMLFAFPLEPLGKGLRALSLSGGAGNIAACLLYVLLCVLPLACLLPRRKKLESVDALPICLTCFLFAALYLLINPGLLPRVFGPLGSAMGACWLGGVFWSIAAAYGVLLVLRWMQQSETEALRGFAVGLLEVFAVLLIFVIFRSCLAELLASMQKVKDGNTAGGWGLTYVFLGIQYLVNALPYILDLMLVFGAQTLLETMQTGTFSDGTVTAAQRLSHLCSRVLAVTVLTNVGWNLLQLFFARGLLTINGMVELPVLSLVLVTALLLVCRMLAEAKTLQEDNDSFI